MKHLRAMAGGLGFGSSLMLVACTSAPNPSSFHSAAATHGVGTSVGLILLEHSGELESIWDGYWGPGHSIGLYPVGIGTLVLSAGESGVGPLSLEDEKLPESLQGRAVVESGAPSGPFQLDYPYAGRRIAAVQVGAPLAAFQPGKEVAPWLTDPVASAVALAAHEGFHTYQNRSFVPIEGSAIPLPGPDLALVRAHQALFDRHATRVQLSSERNALRVAVEATGSADVSRALEVYYSLLADRQASQPAEVSTFEVAQERWEGVATWVGYEAVRVTSELGNDATVRHVAHDLGVDAAMPSQWDAFWRWHLYATGAAKALLLDRIGLDGWQRALERGLSLDSLLQRVYGLAR